MLSSPTATINVVWLLLLSRMVKSPGSAVWGVTSSSVDPGSKGLEDATKLIRRSHAAEMTVLAVQVLHACMTVGPGREFRAPVLLTRAIGVNVLIVAIVAVLSLVDEGAYDALAVMAEDGICLDLREKLARVERAERIEQATVNHTNAFIDAAAVVAAIEDCAMLKGDDVAVGRIHRSAGGRSQPGVPMTLPVQGLYRAGHVVPGRTVDNGVEVRWGWRARRVPRRFRVPPNSDAVVSVSSSDGTPSA